MQKLNQGEIKDIFKDVFNGENNFITPNVVEYKQKQNTIIEISKGDGVFGDYIIFGATVLQFDGLEWIHNHDI